MADKTGIGVIGLGNAGRGHLNAFAGCAKARLVAGADPNEKSWAEESISSKGIKLYNDHRAMLDNKDVDLVVIATPHNMHLPMILDCFDAGKHVFSEKPLAMNSAECDKIISAARKAGRKVFVFQNHRTIPSIRSLKRAVTENPFGEPIAGVLQYLGCEIERMRDTENWKCSYDRAGGGVLLDGGVHSIDLSNWFYGTPVSVEAQLRKPKGWNEKKGETTGNLLVKYESGAISQILASFEALLPGSFAEPTLKVAVELFFENGNAYGEYSYLGKFGMNRITRYVCGSDEMHEVPSEEMESVNFHETVLNSLTNGTEPIVTVEEARMAVAVAEAAYRSAESGKAEAVAPLPLPV